MIRQHNALNGIKDGAGKDNNIDHVGDVKQELSGLLISKWN